MNWYNLGAVFNMGGYGVYVWTAYGLTLLAFGINLFLSLREKRQVRKTLQRYLLQS
jgi:heme exporter protein CcmD